MQKPSTERVAAVFDTMAAHYDRQMCRLERLLFPGLRRWAISHAQGRVVEIAVGTGLNLPLYGPDVDTVIGVDLSEGMLANADQRVTTDRLERIDLRHGDAQALELPDASADTVISTFTFCTIPDPLAAAREAYRVLTPGGQFVLAEHGPSTRLVTRAVMRLIEPLTVRIGADHLTRDPVPYLQKAGFTIDELHHGGRLGMTFQILATRPQQNP